MEVAWQTMETARVIYERVVQGAQTAADRAEALELWDEISTHAARVAAALMIWAAQKGPVLTGSSAYLMLLFYFDVLEGAPLCVALYFHRRMPLWLRDASSLNSNGGSASKGLVNAQHERLLASDEKDGLLTAHSPSPSPPLG